MLYMARKSEALPKDSPRQRIMAKRIAEMPEASRAIASLDYQAAKDAIRDRILARHGTDIVLNRCPVCEKLCRTPKARMCVCCGHTWHVEADG